LVQPVVPSTVPQPLAQVIIRLLAANPAKRFQSARDVIAALDRIEGERTVRSRRSMLAAAAILTVAVVPWKLATRSVPLVSPAAAASVVEPADVRAPDGTVTSAPGDVYSTRDSERTAAGCSVAVDAAPARNGLAHAVGRRIFAAVAKPTAIARSPRHVTAEPEHRLDVAGPLPPSVIWRAIERVTRADAPRRRRAGVRDSPIWRRARGSWSSPARDPRATSSGVLAGVPEAAPTSATHTWSGSVLTGDLHRRLAPRWRITAARTRSRIDGAADFLGMMECRRR
jgi:hypothetical protein